MRVASRTLKLKSGDAIVDVPVELFVPVREANGAWKCVYTIGWPDGVSRKSTFGVDSMQALILALQMIGVELHVSEAHDMSALFWDKPGNGYGFPVMPNMRDQLVGDDAKHL
ncbi:MAG: hypothetical protein JSR72_22780 [Proteobacteria bacterium]|nr:hypothetical protein [Pseudomonadota bacterium]